MTQTTQTTRTLARAFGSSEFLLSTLAFLRTTASRVLDELHGTGDSFVYTQSLVDALQTLSSNPDGQTGDTYFMGCIMIAAESAGLWALQLDDRDEVKHRAEVDHLIMLFNGIMKKGPLPAELSPGIVRSMLCEFCRGLTHAG